MIDKSLLTKIPEGDNGKIIDSDYKLEDYGEDLLPKIAKMPKLDTVIKHYSQYEDNISRNGCTIAVGIDMLATINNYDYTHEQRLSNYEYSKSLGWNPAFGQARGSGLMAAVKRWNTKFPNDKALMFMVELFSDEFNQVIDKLGMAAISINVDSKYWKDVRDNLKLDGYGFLPSGGHATAIMKLEDYICVDSVPQDVAKNKNTPMVYEFGDKQRVEILRDQGNLRNDCHIIIMERRLKEKDPMEIERLTKFKSLLEEAIKVNSDMWFLTTNDAEKKERTRENDYNRGKLAVVEALLK